jgi:hypothetical protein
MPFPVPFIRPQVAQEPPAFVRVVSRSDVAWNRRVFRAPPLDVPPPAVSITPKAAEATKPVLRSPA